MKIVIPAKKIVSINSFYAGMNWRKRKALVEEWHVMTIVAVRDCLDENAKFTEFPCRLVYTIFPRNERMDIGNCCTKMITDGLVIAGVLPDDNLNYVHSEMIQFGGVDAKNPRIELEIQKQEVLL